MKTFKMYAHRRCTLGPDLTGAIITARAFFIRDGNGGGRGGEGRGWREMTVIS